MNRGSGEDPEPMGELVQLEDHAWKVQRLGGDLPYRLVVGETIGADGEVGFRLGVELYEVPDGGGEVVTIRREDDHNAGPSR